MKRRGLIPWLLLMGVLLMVAIGLTTVWIMDPMDCKIAPGVSVGGLEIGGMGRFRAWRALNQAAEEVILSQELLVELPQGELSIAPKSVHLKVHSWKAVADAYKVGRKDTSRTEFLLSDYLSLDEGAILEQLDIYAQHYDLTLTQPSWKVRGQAPDLSTDLYDPEAQGQTVELTLGLPERKLDVPGAMAAIYRGYDRGLVRIDKVVIAVPTKTEPQEIDLQQVYDTCRIDARDDSVDRVHYGFVHGAYGYHFDMDGAKKLLSDASYGDTVSIPMVAYAPEILGEEAYYLDVLGTCETKHTDDENRNTNLALVCSSLNGVVIQPGEEFSYNETVGERTAERGFKPAVVYSGSVKKIDYGGGVCQGSTTLYNCLLLADMEILERNGHGALVSYVPLGLDAAVNWGTKTDLRFRNNSHFPVMIQAELSDGYMKMKLLGIDEKDYYIEMETGQYRQEDYFYATSYKCKYNKQTGELISRERETFSSYVAKLEDAT